MTLLFFVFLQNPLSFLIYYLFYSFYLSLPVLAAAPDNPFLHPFPLITIFYLYLHDPYYLLFFSIIFYLPIFYTRIFTYLLPIILFVFLYFHVGFYLFKSLSYHLTPSILLLISLNYLSSLQLQT